MIRVRAETDRAAAAVRRIQQGLTPEGIDPIVEKVALKSLAGLVAASPKRWFGQIRSGWTIIKPGPGIRQITIPEKLKGPTGVSVADIARFVNFGTADNGTGFIFPKNARRLYIPLMRRAAAGWQPGFIYGSDYVLALKVRGIQGRHFIEPEQAKAQQLMRDEFTTYIRKLVTGN